MAREGTRGSSSRKKSPKKASQNDASATDSATDSATAITTDDATTSPVPESSIQPQQQPHPLSRKEGEGLNRRSLLTGLYGARGERIRHVVASGALAMPQGALDLMAQFEDTNADANSNTATTSKASNKSNKKRKARLLPGLDSVIRPTKDRSLRTISVTDIFHKAFPHPSGDATLAPMMRTVAMNRSINLLEPEASAVSAGDGAERIRGGGDEGQTPEAPTPAVAPAAPSAQPVAPPAAPSAAAPTAVSAVPVPAAQVAAPPTPVAPTPVAAAPTPAPQPAAAPQPVAAPAVPQAVAAPVPAPAAAVASAPVATAATPAPATSTAPAPAAAKPATVTSSERRTSVTAPLEAATDKVIALDKKEAPQWEQHVPAANDENATDPEAKTPKPDWFHPTKPSNLERTLLPEWFDESAAHRTEETYLKARSTMMHISDKLGNRYVSSTLARRSLPGDVGSLHRLHHFLTHYLWMNAEGRNDSAPTAASLQTPPQLVKPSVWTEKRRSDLIHAVVEASQQPSTKKQKTAGAGEGEDDPMEVDTVEEDDADLVIDWDEIAEKVGASAGDCEREFLAMPLDETAAASGTDRPITPEPTTTTSTGSTSSANKPKDLAQEEFLRSLVEESSPGAIKAVTEAALRVSNKNLPAAQRAAQLGLVASQAVKAAQAHEETVSRLLSEVVDQRMKKLECRMALMDDVEGMLEAERVALELERRDLYTTRCRDWFGGG